MQCIRGGKHCNCQLYRQHAFFFVSSLCFLFLSSRNARLESRLSVFYIRFDSLLVYVWWIAPHSLLFHPFYFFLFVFFFLPGSSRKNCSNRTANESWNEFSQELGIERKTPARISYSSPLTSRFSEMFLVASLRSYCHAWWRMMRKKMRVDRWAAVLSLCVIFLRKVGGVHNG